MCRFDKLCTMFTSYDLVIVTLIKCEFALQIQILEVLQPKNLMSAKNFLDVKSCTSSFLSWFPFDGFALIFPAPPLKLIDLPGFEQRIVDDSMVSCIVLSQHIFSLLVCSNMHIILDLLIILCWMDGLIFFFKIRSVNMLHTTMQFCW